MHEKPPSLIQGLDPAALFALDVEEPAAAEWEPPSLEEAAKLFPQWKVILLLGRGGMGAVFEVHQPELDRTVAVKLLPIEASRDEHLVERFRREARTLARLRHPGIVALFESGITSAGHFYFVMEHVDGSPLSSLIAEGRLDVPKAIEIVCQVCEALAYAHAQGVIHRDIKPSNILIDQTGRAKVADFGLARLDQTETASGALSMSRTGQFMGTPAYAAPEQVKDAAHVDHRADIYALGVLLYEMLTGDLPRGVFQPPSRKTSDAAHLDDVVRRAMQERPEDRYQAAADLQKDITHTARSGNTVLVLLLIALAAAVAWFGKGQWTQQPQKWTQKTEVTLSTPATEVAKTSASTAPTPTPPHAPVSKPPVFIPTPAPAPQPVLASSPLVEAWSLDAVSPALQPPVDLTKRPWKDAVLTSTGGTVLLEDGSIAIWHESQPNTAQNLAIKAQSLGNSADRVLALDSANRLIDIENGQTVLEGCKAVFSSAKAGIVPAMTLADEAFLLDLGSLKRTPLPKADFAQVAVDAEGVVWCLLVSGELQKLDGSTFAAAPQQGVSTAAQMAVGTGFMALVEPSGRCVLFGPGVIDSPQRFRLPAGTHTLRTGSQGRMVAW